MSIRKPTLAEWAYIYFHERIWGRGFFVPITLDIDVTEIDHAWRAVGKTAPWTAIFLHAMARTAELHPAVNRALVKPWGQARIIDFEQVSIALPVLGEFDGKPEARIEIVRDVHRLTLAQVKDLLRSLKTRELKRTGTLTAFLRSWPNNLFTRAVVRFGIAWVELRPRYYEKTGAGLGLSSLITVGEPGFSARPIALGPSGLGVTLTSPRTDENGRVWLDVGICFNHLVCRGDEAFVAGRTLWRMVTGRTEGGLAPYLPVLEDSAAPVPVTNAETSV